MPVGIFLAPRCGWHVCACITPNEHTYKPTWLSICPFFLSVPPPLYVCWSVASTMPAAAPQLRCKPPHRPAPRLLWLPAVVLALAVTAGSCHGLDLPQELQAAHLKAILEPTLKAHLYCHGLLQQSPVHKTVSSPTPKRDIQAHELADTLAESFERCFRAVQPHVQVTGTGAARKVVLQESAEAMRICKETMSEAFSFYGKLVPVFWYVGCLLTQT